MPAPLAYPIVAGGMWAYRAYQAYRATQAARVVAQTAQAATAAATPQNAAKLAAAAAAAKALSNSKARDKAEDCCKENPCAHLANGRPGSKYRGGAHASTKGPKGDNLDSHHTPAAEASYLHREVGPAIQMEKADHMKTASNPVGKAPGAAAAYIAAQSALINSGNFMGAIEMDVADVRKIAGSKYDDAIAQMKTYANCLKEHGLIK